MLAMHGYILFFHHNNTLYGSVEKVYYPDNTIEWKSSIAGVTLITQHFNSSGSTIGVAQRYLFKIQMNFCGHIMLAYKKMPR